MNGCRSGAEPRAALLLLSLILGACAASPGAGAASPGAAAVHGRSTVPAQEPASEAQAPSPEQALAQAEALERDVLGLSARGAPDATTRQITSLRQARELYEQFIDHAKNRPEMSDAMERSRERIKDIDQTIEFLDKGASSEALPGP